MQITDTGGEPSTEDINDRLKDKMRNKEQSQIKGGYWGNVLKWLQQRN